MDNLVKKNHCSMFSSKNLTDNCEAATKEELQCCSCPKMSLEFHNFFSSCQIFIRKIKTNLKLTSNMVFYCSQKGSWEREWTFRFLCQTFFDNLTDYFATCLYASASQPVLRQLLLGVNFINTYRRIFCMNKLKSLLGAKAFAIPAQSIDDSLQSLIKLPLEVPPIVSHLTFSNSWGKKLINTLYIQ